MNLGEMKQLTLMHLDEMKVGKTSRNEYLAKMNEYADIAQKKAIQAKPILKTHYITQANVTTDNLIPNQLTLFDIKVHEDSDVVYQANGAKAYHFAVDDVSTVYIEELNNGVWEVLETINYNPVIKDGFKAYKGIISASNPNNDIRIRFSGNYRYNFRNIALYKSNYPSADRIPNFERYTYYTMPSDFNKFIKIVKRNNFSDSWVTAIDYKWQGKNILRLNLFDSGEYMIEYEALPTKIDSNTPDDFEFELDEDVCQAIPYFVAALCVMKEDDKRPYDTFMEQFDSLMMNLDNGYVATVQVVNQLF